MSKHPTAPKMNGKDRELLDIVATAKWITHSQLFEMASISRIEDNRKVFEWRVRRLSQCGLLKKRRPAFLDRRILYSFTGHGVCALEVLGVHPVAFMYDRGDEDVKHQIPHSLEVNRVRIALMRSGTLIRWMPESTLRVLYRAGQRNYAKIYDAVATVMLDGEICEIGLEYERSLKAVERYREAASRIEDEHRVDAVVYLCPSNNTFTTISDVFFRSHKTVLVAMMEEFVRDPLDGHAELRMLATSLRQELRKTRDQPSGRHFGTIIPSRACGAQ
jgi:hypothetical protein